MGVRVPDEGAELDALAGGSVCLCKQAYILDNFRYRLERLPSIKFGPDCTEGIRGRTDLLLTRSTFNHLRYNSSTYIMTRTILLQSGLDDADTVPGRGNKRPYSQDGQPLEGRSTSSLG